MDGLVVLVVLDVLNRQGGVGGLHVEEGGDGEEGQERQAGLGVDAGAQGVCQAEDGDDLVGDNEPAAKEKRSRSSPADECARERSLLTTNVHIARRQTHGPQPGLRSSKCVQKLSVCFVCRAQQVLLGGCTLDPSVQQPYQPQFEFGGGISNCGRPKRKPIEYHLLLAVDAPVVTVHLGAVEDRSGEAPDARQLGSADEGVNLILAFRLQGGKATQGHSPCAEHEADNGPSLVDSHFSASEKRGRGLAPRRQRPAELLATAHA